jgi:hypothetical protein
MCFLKFFETYSASTTAIISILAIISTTCIATYSIRKTAEDNKINIIFNEMFRHLVHQVQNHHRIIILSYNLANNIQHYKLPKHEFIETAFTRFWRELGEFKNMSDERKAYGELVFPQELTTINNSIIDAFNKFREQAKDEHQINTQQLIILVNEMISGYNQLVVKGREFLGTKAISKITIEDIKLLSDSDKS